MVTVEWCLKNKNGIKIIEPNINMSNSYFNMAEDSIKVLNNIKDSKIWIATTSYYIFYYSLYSLMLRIGVKCEIHSCSLEFMKQYLNEFYNQKDMEMINEAFGNRSDLQYYADRPVDDTSISEVKLYSKDFFVKTKLILSRIKEYEIDIIREKLKNLNVLIMMIS